MDILNKICTNMRSGLVMLFLVVGISSAYSQLNELSIIRPSENQINSAIGTEKARLYFESGNLKLAEALLYTELEKGNFSVSDFLLFANTLIADNKPSLATEFYAEYLEQRGKNSGNEANMLQLLDENPESNFNLNRLISGFPITNPSIFENHLYSSDNKGRMFQYNLDCDGTVSNPKQIFQDVTSMPFGKVAFFDEGNKAVASVWNKSTEKYALWLLQKKRGKWAKPKELFSAERAHFAFPYVDDANKALYFASDKPGGHGGFDIYVSMFDGKNFDEPINLGKDVNTPWNEINPVFTNKWLYFSSNGHISKGGYDLYKFNGMEEFDGVLVNTHSFNTKIDDLAVMPLSVDKYFSVQAIQKEYYFNTFIKKAPQDQYLGSVQDETGNYISGAHLFVVAEDGANGLVTTTNNEGQYHFRLPVQTDVSAVRVIADGFQSQSINLDSSVNIILKEVEPTIVVVKEYVPIRVPADTNTVQRDNPNVDSLGVIKTSNTEPFVMLESENVGNANAHSAPHQPDRGLYYIIIGSSEDYSQAFQFWQEWSTKFDNLEILEYSNGLYRIGFYAGASDEAAMIEFNEAKKVKEEIWMLRPRS